MTLPRRAFLSFGAAALALGLSRRARAGDDAGVALAAIAKARGKLRTLDARFTQERTIELLATKVTSEGRMILVRPDRLRWELFPPDAATYFVGPDGLAYETAAGRGRASASAAGPLGRVLRDLSTMLGGDLASLRDRYDVTVANDSDGTTVAVRPRAADVAKLVRRIELALATDLVTPRSIVLEEGERDRSVVRFSRVVRDAAVDPALVTPPR